MTSAASISLSLTRAWYERVTTRIYMRDPSDHLLEVVGVTRLQTRTTHNQKHQHPVTRRSSHP